MSLIRFGGIALISALCLGACAPNMMNGGLVNPWAPVVNPTPVPTPPTYVDVYKSQGSRQCENGGVPLAEMQRQLQAANIPVVNSACGTDGRMYPSFCGGADGKINILSIPSDAVAAASTQGFALLSSLPGAQRTNCYAGNNAPNNNPPPNVNTGGDTTTYPLTGGRGDVSYYSYQ